MRCYFMRDGHIQAVEFLTTDNDESRIEEAQKLFDSNRVRLQADGFEIWEGPRFIYRFPKVA